MVLAVVALTAGLLAVGLRGPTATPTSATAPTGTEAGVAGSARPDPRSDLPPSPGSVGAVSVGYRSVGPLPVSEDRLHELLAFVEVVTGRPFRQPPVLVFRDRRTHQAHLAAHLGRELDDVQLLSDLWARYTQAVSGTGRSSTMVNDELLSALLTGPAALSYVEFDTDTLHVAVDEVRPDGTGAVDDLVDTETSILRDLVRLLDDQWVDPEPGHRVAPTPGAGRTEAGIVLGAIMEGRSPAVVLRWLTDQGLPVGGEPGWPAPLADMDDSPDSTRPIPFPEGGDEAAVAVGDPEVDGTVLWRWDADALEVHRLLLDGTPDSPPGATVTMGGAGLWAGGRGVLWGDSEQSCVRIALATTDPTALADAFGAWADRRDKRTVVELDGTVVVTSCGSYLP